MNRNLIPWSGVLQESFIYDNTIKTRILYILVLIAFGIALILLPLVKINLSFRAGGMILSDDMETPGMSSLLPPGLIAELYIPSKDIAQVSEGQKVRLRVDAYDHYQWGYLQGEISSISDDYIIYENTPVFKVNCRLEKNYLSTKNGNKGTLRTGMTVTARFLIAKRSLFQLLCQRSEDWFNPSLSSIPDSR